MTLHLNEVLKDTSKKVKVYGVIVLAIVGVLTLSLVNSHQQSLNIKAQTTNTQVTRGVAGDSWADIILGKSSFGEVVPNSVVPGHAFFPRSVVVDRSNSSDNKIYIYDGGNSRILGIDLPNCLAHQGDPLHCSADIVIGQPASHSGDTNFGKTAACNGDSAFQNYPTRAPATASTLCSLPESQLSIAENGTGSNMYTDTQGNLYVTDSYNHRVLKYNSPFAQSGTIAANDVWGQNDFTGNSCNKGQGSPDATTLCFGWSGNNNKSAGVDFDASGNMWIADSANNRVLRFPPGSHTADLVIGQNSFSTNASGNGLNQLFAPSSVKFTDNGQLFVSDNSNNRIMVYTSPFSTGMNGTVFAPTAQFSSPSGLSTDPTQPGKIWIQNEGFSTVELWDVSSQTLVRTLGLRGNGNIINDSAGSIGVDSNGNVYVGIKGANYGDDVIQYPAGGPYDYPTHQFFGGGNPGNGGINTENFKDQYGLLSGAPVVAGSQLIVADGSGGILFWNVDPTNPPSSLSNGKPADGYIIESSFNSTAAAGSIFGIRASNTHLYVARSRYANGVSVASITVYNLPLVTGEQPNTNQTFYLPLNVLGGGQINYNSNDDPYWSLLPAPDDSYIWVTDANNSRVFRVRNPLTSPLVDVILGQTSPAGTLCNGTGNPVTDATPTTLCWPGWISQDRQGNMYVSDWSPENRGNWRLLEYNANLFPTNNQTTILAPPASKIFTQTAVGELAFDSQNHMVAGYQRYFNQNPPGYEFPGVYLNPLAPAPTPPAQIQPDSHLSDYSSGAFAMTFDNFDNLYVGECCRSRVEIYLTPLNTNQPSPTQGATPTPIPTIPPPTPTPTTNLPTPTPTPFIDIIPPTVSITSPLNGATIQPGSKLTIQATASDNVGVTRVEFRVNNSLKCNDNTSPYTCVWNVPGSHGTRYTLTATAYDAANNSASYQIIVTTTAR